MRVNVVGAGVVGLCVASELLERGIGVTLVERAACLGPNAGSWWASGLLSPFSDTSDSSDALSRLGPDSIDWWRRQGVAVTRAGSLVIAPQRDQDDLRLFARHTQRHRALDGPEIAQLEPCLVGRFSSGLYFADEALLSPRDALRILSEQIGSRSDVHYNWTTDALPPADWTIEARGLTARDVLPELRAVKGEMLILRCPGFSLSRPLRLLHAPALLDLIPRGKDLFLLGTTLRENNERPHILTRTVLDLLNTVYAVHPAFADAELVEMAVDWRPAFPDNLPRLVRRGRTVHVNGIFRHGFLFGPVLARMVADMILYPERQQEFLVSEPASCEPSQR